MSARTEGESSTTLDLANRLRHLLPPRPAGTQAVLEELPHAVVVLLAPVGLEGFVGLAGIRKRVPLQRRNGHRGSIDLAAWLLDRDEVPNDPIGSSC